MANKTIGFRSCRAGLTNQKFALLGLVQTAKAEGASIRLPRIVNFSPKVGDAVSDVPFSSIFDEQAFRDYCTENHIVIEDGDINNLHYSEAFSYGGKVRMEDRIAFLRSLRPSKELQELIRNVCSAAYGDDRETYALQLRIERDWYAYVKNKLSNVPGEDNGPHYRTIIDKVTNTLGEGLRIYITCDEDSIDVRRADIDKFAYDRHKCTLIWKRDVCPSQELNFAMATELDFRVALAAKTFIGLSRSTFSNVMCGTKAAIDTNDWQHYIYNVSQPRLYLRTDRGQFSKAEDAISELETSIRN